MTEWLFMSYKDVEEFVPTDIPDLLIETLFKGVIICRCEVFKNSKEVVREAFNKLTPREKKVIGMRFGFLGDSPCTLEEVGKDFSCTRERIRQIEKKALRKIRVAITKNIDQKAGE